MDQCEPLTLEMEAAQTLKVLQESLEVHIFAKKDARITKLFHFLFHNRGVLVTSDNGGHFLQLVHESNFRAP